jgi:hypothetical protein
VVQFGEPWRAEALGEGHLHLLLFDLVTQDPMVDVTGKRGSKIACECGGFNDAVPM